MKPGATSPSKRRRQVAQGQVGGKAERMTHELSDGVCCLTMRASARFLTPSTLSSSCTVVRNQSHSASQLMVVTCLGYVGVLCRSLVVA
jgi:hypothetical protein